MEDRNEVTQRILNLTLEILYLLTGEDYIIVRKPGGRTTNSKRLQVVEGFCRKQTSISGSPPCPSPSERSEEKILELTTKMMELLTGEVPIRCQDVSVYFSMEEWEYLGGHRDLYKDVLLEDRQSPDESRSRRPSGETCFPMMASDSMDACDGDWRPEGIDACEGYRRPEGIDTCEGYQGPEGIDTCEGYRRPEGIDTCEGDWRPEGMDACEGYRRPEGMDACEGDLGPGGMDACEGYRRPGGMDACEGDLGPGGMDACEGYRRPGGMDACEGHTTASSAEGYQMGIKEEPLSDEEGGGLSRPIPYASVRIKEEPQEEVPSDDHIKVETVSAEEDNCSISTPRDQGQSTPAHIKEEPVTFLNVLDISRQTLPTHTIPETLAYEVEIPVDKAPVKGPDNASLYSVRQKEDSMEILYHCPSCYKGFSSNLDLARHQVIHTVDKLFICSLCGKSFTEMSFLVKHQVIHTDLKLCVCPVCGGCFYSETSLAKHQKTHSLPLFCSTCGKCFFNKTELAIHERKHSGERPFGCHVCGKHFIAKSVLNKHMLIHTSMDLRK